METREKNRYNGNVKKDKNSAQEHFWR